MRQYTLPTSDNLKTIAEYFNVSCDYLLGRSRAAPPDDFIQEAVRRYRLPVEALNALEILLSGARCTDYPAGSQEFDVLRLFQINTDITAAVDLLSRLIQTPLFLGSIIALNKAVEYIEPAVRASHTVGTTTGDAFINGDTGDITLTAKGAANYYRDIAISEFGRIVDAAIDERRTAAEERWSKNNGNNKRT